MGSPIIVAGHYLIRLGRNGIPCDPLLSGVVVEVARVRGSEFIIVPTLVIVGIDQGKMFCISEEPATNWIVNPTGYKGGFSDLDRFLQVFIGNR